jgi:hypothetical protein
MTPAPANPGRTSGPNGHAGTDAAANQPDAPAHPDDLSDVTLADLLEDLAGDYPDVRSVEVPEGLDYLAGERPFARLAGLTAHFRLRAEIVAAAVRTPAAAVSPLGPDWVLFRPGSLDQYGLDRAQAWFELGHRLASEASRPGRARP